MHKKLPSRLQLAHENMDSTGGSANYLNWRERKWYQKFLGGTSPPLLIYLTNACDDVLSPGSGILCYTTLCIRTLTRHLISDQCSSSGETITQKTPPPQWEPFTTMHITHPLDYSFQPTPLKSTICYLSLLPIGGIFSSHWRSSFSLLPIVGIFSSYRQNYILISLMVQLE